MKRLSSGLFVLLLTLVFVSGCDSDTVKVNGVSLEYEFAMHGDLVVLFDAGAISGMEEGWASIWDKLPKNIAALRYSRRGEGNSSPCEKQISITEYAEDLEALLKKLQVKSPIVYVSHSLGGIVAREYAARNPGKVMAMLFVDPANPRDVEIIRELNPVAGNAEIEQIKRKDFADGGNRWCFLNAIWDKSTPPGLTEIGDIPVTLIAGTRRFKNPIRTFDTDSARHLWGLYQAEWVNQFPQGKAVITENSGHFVQDDEPELVLRELELLLRSLESS